MDDTLPNESPRKQLSAWFLGPKAENADLEEQMLLYILRDYFHWRRNYYPSDDAVITQQMRRATLDWSDNLFQQIVEMVGSLKRHFPFYSPRYIGHQLSDQTIPAVLGYFAGMLYNPNNVTTEASPVTVDWELQVGHDILRMLGYKVPNSMHSKSHHTNSEYGWAHITSGGTVANIEALWIARNIRYFPMAAKAVALDMGLEIEVKLPDLPPDRVQPITNLSDRQTVTLKPNEAIYMFDKLVDAVRRRLDIPVSERKLAESKTWTLLEESGLSLAGSGVSQAFSKCPPAIFVSGAAHYSIKKAANILGIGEENVILIDVDSRYRADIRDLEWKIKSAIRDGLFPFAVIGISGTTEEGAVDPIHKITDLRMQTEKELGVSFWLHIDSAWSGYIRSIFVTDQNDERKNLDKRIDEINQFVKRDFTIRQGSFEKNIRIQWGNKEVCSAFLAFPRAESISIDPHKMGYIPYPCGAVAFRNDRIRQFLKQEATYINMANLGGFILEGSKPGAAASAVWLSHRTIPPNRLGYGEIIRASLLSARELYERLTHFEKAYEQMLKGMTEAKRIGYPKLPVYQIISITAQPPDTNIVCFVVKERGNHSLGAMNQVTEEVFKNFSINVDDGKQEYSYSQPFFLSSHRFRPPNYSLKAVSDLLERAEVSSREYAEQGIFVLRAAVMTPYITMAAENQRTQSLLSDFVAELADKSEKSVNEIRQNELSQKLKR